MKILLQIFLILLSFNAFSQNKVITLKEVSEKVKTSNFNVLKDAQRVYQAKEMINFSKRNLLPKLNVWNVLKLPFDWASSIDIVQDIAPFLVPNNWFRVKENKYLYEVKKQQYRALWANEIMTAKLLYLNALRDQSFLNVLSSQKRQISNLVTIAKTKELMGTLAPQVSKFLQIRELEISEDVRNLEVLVYEEKKAINFILGESQDVNIVLTEIKLPNIDELEPILYDNVIDKAIAISPELNQYAYLKKVLKKIRKEITFSFLGASTTARGSAGGYFSNLPIQDGLGFGLGASIKISKREGHIIDLNLEATTEVIKKNLLLLTYSLNSMIENIDNQNLRLELAEDNFYKIQSSLILGAKFDPFEILTSIDNLADASISLENYKYEVVTTLEKIQRSVLEGDYDE